MSGVSPGRRRRRLGAKRRPGSVRAKGLAEEFGSISAKPAVGNEPHGDAGEHQRERQLKGVVGILAEAEAGEEAGEAGKDGEGTPAHPLGVDSEPLFEVAIHRGGVQRKVAGDHSRERLRVPRWRAPQGSTRRRGCCVHRASFACI